MLECPHCGQPIFKSSNGGAKLKAKTSMLVLHKSGEVEINCGICRQGVFVPLDLKQGPIELRKAESKPAVKLVVPRT
jgi:hypothetical protein